MQDDDEARAQQHEEDKHKKDSTDRKRCWFALKDDDYYCGAPSTWRIINRESRGQGTYLCDEHKIAWQRATYPDAVVGLFDVDDERIPQGLSYDAEGIEIDDFLVCLRLRHV